MASLIWQVRLGKLLNVRAGDLIRSWDKGSKGAVSAADFRRNVSPNMAAALIWQPTTP